MPANRNIVFMEFKILCMSFVSPSFRAQMPQTEIRSIEFFTKKKNWCSFAKPHTSSQTQHTRAPAAFQDTPVIPGGKGFSAREGDQRKT